MIQTKVSTVIQCLLKDAETGATVKEFPRQSNLVLDNALNALAQGTNACGLQNCATYCHVGDGTDPNSIASGAVTFTQSGTTLTASAGFFTSAMVGGIFKWGTGSGGTERYIVTFTDSTHVELDASETVGTPAVGTVWQVQQTTLDNELYRSGTYQTNSGDNQMSGIGSAGTITAKRTFVFPLQASSYNVNEVGWGPSNTTLVLGRLVLGATVVVPPTNFLVVIVNVTFTMSPKDPTAVSNVGTNINTAGDAMIEVYGSGNILSDGSSSAGSLSTGTNSVRMPNVTYTQNTDISGTALAPASLTLKGTTTAWVKQSARGTCTLTAAYSLSTTGQSLYGIALYDSNGFITFDVKFTTAYTAPNGTFQGTVVFQQVYNRTLTN